MNTKKVIILDQKCNADYVACSSDNLRSVYFLNMEQQVVVFGLY